MEAPHPGSCQSTALSTSCRTRPAPPTTVGGGVARPGGGAPAGLPSRAPIGPSCPRDARPRPRPSSASARGSGQSGAEWARAPRRGLAGALGPGLATRRRPLPSMRTKAAGGAERRPPQLRTKAAAAAPAGRGKWRSPLLGVVGPAGWGRRCPSAPTPAWLGLAAPPRPRGQLPGQGAPGRASRVRGLGVVAPGRLDGAGGAAAHAKCGRGGGAGVNRQVIGSSRSGPFSPGVPQQLGV